MAPSSHIRLRFTGGRPPRPADKRNELEDGEEWAILTCLDRTALSINARKIIPLIDGVKILVHGESDVDKILSDSCKKLLLELKLQPYCSPEMIAAQTIVIRTNSALIHGTSEEELIKSIKKQHPKVVITSIWKDRKMGIVKIQCKNTTEANKLKSTDFKLMGYTMRADDLEFGEFIPVRQCLRCYELDTHVSSTCEFEGMVCGECGSREHRHPDCDKSKQGCINCMRAGDLEHQHTHHARSNACPLKKRILQRKRRERNQSTTRARSTSRAYADAPAPATNAWQTTGNRSQSRGRGNRRGMSRGGGRGASKARPADGRPGPNENHPNPRDPRLPPANTEKSYPELAHNIEERKKKRNRKKNKGNQQHPGQAQEQVHGTSAPGTAATGVPIGFAAPQAMDYMETTGMVSHITPPVAPAPPAPYLAPTRPAAPAPRAVQSAPSHPQPATPASVSAINIILTACHQHNMVRPGEFDAKARELLAENHLPPVNLGNNWHSAEFIALISGTGNPVTSQCSCNCKCQNQPEQPQQPPRQQPNASPVIQEAPLASQVSPVPVPFTAQVTELVLDSDIMDTQTQGTKRAREPQSPTNTPEDTTAPKRQNKIHADDNAARTLAVSKALQKELDNTVISIAETGKSVTLADVVDELSSSTQMVDPLSPIDVFIDAEDGSSTTPKTSAPEKGESGLDDLPEVPAPEKLMPPPPPRFAPEKEKRGHSRARRRLTSSELDRSRSSSAPRTPQKIGESPRPAKGQTPLKRTSSQRTVAEDFPSTPTNSQLDRALEEALESDCSVESNSSRSSKGKKKSCRSRARTRATASSHTHSTPSGGGRMNDIGQCMWANEIIRSRIEITTAEEKIKQRMEKNISHYSIQDLIEMWRKGRIVIEVKPKIPTCIRGNVPEPDWRKKKYESLTRILYEKKIGDHEWIKYKDALPLVLKPPELVPSSALDTRERQVLTRLNMNREQLKETQDLTNFLWNCPSPPRMKIKADLAKNTGNVDFFDPSQQSNPSQPLATNTASGWTQDVPALTSEQDSNSYSQRIQ